MNATTITPHKEKENCREMKLKHKWQSKKKKRIIIKTGINHYNSSYIIQPPTHTHLKHLEKAMHSNCNQFSLLFVGFLVNISRECDNLCWMYWDIFHFTFICLYAPRTHKPDLPNKKSALDEYWWNVVFFAASMHPFPIEWAKNKFISNKSKHFCERNNPSYTLKNCSVPFYALLKVIGSLWKEIVWLR